MNKKKIESHIKPIVTMLLEYLKQWTGEEYSAIFVSKAKFDEDKDEPIIQESDLPRRKRDKVQKDSKKKVPARHSKQR